MLFKYWRCMCPLLFIICSVTMRNNAVNAGNQNCTCLKSVNSCRQPLDMCLETAQLDQESSHC